MLKRKKYFIVLMQFMDELKEKFASFHLALHFYNASNLLQWTVCIRYLHLFDFEM